MSGPTAQDISDGSPQELQAILSDNAYLGQVVEYSRSPFISLEQRQQVALMFNAFVQAAIANSQGLANFVDERVFQALESACAHQDDSLRAMAQEVVAYCGFSTNALVQDAAKRIEENMRAANSQALVGIEQVRGTLANAEAAFAGLRDLQQRMADSTLKRFGTVEVTVQELQAAMTTWQGNLDAVRQQAVAQSAEYANAAAQRAMASAKLFSEGLSQLAGANNADLQAQITHATAQFTDDIKNSYTAHNARFQRLETELLKFTSECRALATSAGIQQADLKRLTEELARCFTELYELRTQAATAATVNALRSRVDGLAKDVAETLTEDTVRDIVLKELQASPAEAGSGQAAPRGKALINLETRFGLLKDLVNEKANALKLSVEKLAADLDVHAEDSGVLGERVDKVEQRCDAATELIRQKHDELSKQNAELVKANKTLVTQNQELVKTSSAQAKKIEALEARFEKLEKLVRDSGDAAAQPFDDGWRTSVEELIKDNDETQAAVLDQQEQIVTLGDSVTELKAEAKKFVDAMAVLAGKVEEVAKNRQTPAAPTRTPSQPKPAQRDAGRPEPVMTRSRTRASLGEKLAAVKRRQAEEASSVTSDTDGAIEHLSVSSGLRHALDAELSVPTLLEHVDPKGVTHANFIHTEDEEALPTKADELMNLTRYKLWSDLELDRHLRSTTDAGGLMYFEPGFSLKSKKAAVAVGDAMKEWDLFTSAVIKAREEGKEDAATFTEIAKRLWKARALRFIAITPNIDAKKATEAFDAAFSKWENERRTLAQAAINKLSGAMPNLKIPVLVPTRYAFDKAQDEVLKSCIEKPTLTARAAEKRERAKSQVAAQRAVGDKPAAAHKTAAAAKAAKNSEEDQ